MRACVGVVLLRAGASHQRKRSRCASPPALVLLATEIPDRNAWVPASLPKYLPYLPHYLTTEIPAIPASLPKYLGICLTTEIPAIPASTEMPEYLPHYLNTLPAEFILTTARPSLNWQRARAEPPPHPMGHC